MQTRDDLSYTAGFFDGEGSVTIERSIKATGCVQFELRVSVSSVNKTSLERLQKLYGGKMRHCTNKYKGFWNWYLLTHEAAAFLRRIEPFLLTKKLDAAIGVKFQELVLPFGVRALLSESNKAEREELRNQLLAGHKI